MGTDAAPSLEFCESDPPGDDSSAESVAEVLTEFLLFGFGSVFTSELLRFEGLDGFVDSSASEVEADFLAEHLKRFCRRR